MARLNLEFGKRKLPQGKSEGIEEHLLRTLHSHREEHVELPAYVGLEFKDITEDGKKIPEPVEEALAISRSINIATGGLGGLRDKYKITPKNLEAYRRMIRRYLSAVRHSDNPKKDPYVLMCRDQLLAAYEGNLYPRSKGIGQPIIGGVVDFFMNIIRSIGGGQFAWKGMTQPEEMDTT